MAARPIGQLPAAAAAAAVPGCFDAVQSGSSLWVAARTGSSTVAVSHAPAGSGSAGSSVHSVLQLPEPVAAVQLGAPTAAAGAAAAAAGTAVLLVVGESCRAWAFQLQPHQSRGGAEPTAELAADPAAAAEVPVAQQRCPARHQLVAAVAWEHLCYAWEPAAAAAQQAGSGRGGRRGTAAAGAAVTAVLPVSLASLHAALRQQQQQQQQQQGELPLVHSVAGWVCHPRLQQPAPAIPADAVAAACISLAAPADSDGAAAPRLACGSRFEAQAARAGGSGRSSSGGGSFGGALGYLVVAAGSGQIQALPIGLPTDAGAAAAAATAGGGRLPLAVCWSAAGSMHFLPAPAAAGGSSGSGSGSKLIGEPAPRLALLGASGRLVAAGEIGLACSEPIVIAAGSSGAGGGSNGACHGQQGGGEAGASGAWPFAAAVQLVGVQAAAVAGGRMLYLASGTGGGSLRCLDASAGLSAAAATAAGAAAVELPASAGHARLLAAAADPAGKEQMVVLLTERGGLLALPLPGSPPGGASSSEQLSMRQLEGSMQALLGGIAELSERQEAVDEQHRRLDRALAGLAAAIPAAEGAAAARPGPGLRCALRPLALRSRALAGGGGGGGGEALLLEVCLENSGRLALEGSWSLLLVCRSSSGGGGGDGGSVAFAAALGGLQAGGEWRRECEVPLPAGSRGSPGGLLRVLLCRHGSASPSGTSPSGSCMLLLHSVQLDALHLLSLGGAGSGGGGERHAAAAGGVLGDTGACQLGVSLTLQLPQSICGVHATAGALLQQVLAQGLSSRPQHEALEQQAPAGLPSPAFSLLLPPHQQPPAASSGGGSCGSSITAGDVRLSARLLPPPPLPGSGSQWLLQVEASAADPAALLACHQGLCRRALQLPAAAAAAAGKQQQQGLPWQRLPDGSVLLPPGANQAAAAAAAAAAAPGALAAVDEAALDQALLRMRQLKAEAMHLRDAAATAAAAAAAAAGGAQGSSAADDAAQQQAERQRRAAELQRLALAARQGLPPVVIA